MQGLHSFTSLPHDLVAINKRGWSLFTLIGTRQVRGVVNGKKKKAILWGTHLSLVGFPRISFSCWSAISRWTTCPIRASKSALLMEIAQVHVPIGGSCRTGSSHDAANNKKKENKLHLCRLTCSNRQSSIRLSYRYRWLICTMPKLYMCWHSLT